MIVYKNKLIQSAKCLRSSPSRFPQHSSPASFTAYISLANDITALEKITGCKDEPKLVAKKESRILKALLTHTKLAQRFER